MIMPGPTPPPASIDCETAVRRLWDYLDGELDPARAAEVDAHLAGCAECPPHFGFARTFLEALAAGRGARDGEPALRARVLTALSDEGFRRDGSDA
jgi:anti-sigma factor (TIGR02949 family)